MHESASELTKCSVPQLTSPRQDKPVFLLILAILAVGFFGAQSATAWAVSYSVLYSFGPAPDGDIPAAPLLAGKNGILYGTAYAGGTDLNGTVFSLSPPASPGSSWIETTLHSFSNSNDVISPLSAVVADRSGTLYGLGSGALAGGTPGGVFALSPPSAPDGTWTESVLHQFRGYPDGATPSSLILGKGGILYGTTSYGGTGFSSRCGGCGIVFALKSSGGSGETLYNFQGPPDGYEPSSILLSGKDPAILGTTLQGGASYCGAVFRLTPPPAPGGKLSEELIYSFADIPDGCTPSSGLVADRNGVLYGTTAMGGTFWGTVFSLTPPAAQGQSWTETVLYNFGSFTKDGELPGGNLIVSPNGVLYGTTLGGGERGMGTVYSLTPPTSPGDAWIEDILHSFAGSPDGDAPNGLILQDGVLYGTTQHGGTAGAGCNGGCGTVFAVVP